MKALEIVVRRQREIEMETTAPLRISASASFLNALIEESPQVRRNGYDFFFAPKGFTEPTSSRLGSGSFPLLQKEPPHPQQSPHTIEGMLRLWRMLRPPAIGEKRFRRFVGRWIRFALGFAQFTTHTASFARSER
jgi:hypothetical protein